MQAELVTGEAAALVLRRRSPARSAALLTVPDVLRISWRGLLSGVEEGRVKARSVCGVPAGERASEIDDFVLLRARRGDHAAFREIVDHYEERLRILAFHMLRDGEQMNDAVQDTFVKAYVALPGFRGDASFGTWLHSICCRVCLDHLRAVKTRPVTEQMDDRLADPADEVGRLALRDEVVVALSELPALQRAALLLVDGQGYDYATVAEALDVPVGTIASRLSKARIAFKGILASRERGDASGSTRVAESDVPGPDPILEGGGS
jgi:RNA polymerase sigma-70 factor, ECF subfamily